MSPGWGRFSASLSLSSPPLALVGLVKYSIKLNHTFLPSAVLLYPLPELWGWASWNVSVPSGPLYGCCFSITASPLLHWDTRQLVNPHPNRDAMGPCGQALSCPPLEQPSLDSALALRKQICWQSGWQAYLFPIFRKKLLSK